MRMLKSPPFFLLLFIHVGCASPIVYPLARASHHIDTLHGVEVADPYRWLENSNSQETKAWIQAQNDLTFGILGQSQYRQRIRNRLTQLWNYAKHGLPYKKGGRYFFSKNSGLQNQPVLYWTDNLAQEPKLLIDPNTFSKDGTVALSNWQPSPDGKLLAYGVSQSGSDWITWKVLEIETGKHLSDLIEWTKFTTAAWTKDNTGFYYGRYKAPTKEAKLEESNYFNQLYYHKLNTPQSEDRLVHENTNEKEWGFSPQVTDDGKYLLVSVWKGTDDRNRLLVKEIANQEAALIPLIDTFEAGYEVLGNDESRFYVKTTLNAPKGRIIVIDLAQPQPTAWKELISENEDTLEHASMVGSKLVLRYLHNAYNAVRIYDTHGTLIHNVNLPGMGSVSGGYGNRTDSETYFGFTSYTSPSSVFRLNVDSGKQEPFWKPKLQFNPNLYETKQIFYPSKDGTPIPLFITHKKGIIITGNTPTLLYGYGGFNISIKPRFYVSSLVWMEMGGIYAVANIRGGGEFGEKWHQAGTKHQKQNVFDDFQSAAKWLVTHGYTQPNRLAIKGRSNGGLLVGACITQAPQLFGAALPGVGVMDMIRFHKFTIGWAWTDDYGSAENAAEFKTLLAYSPLHNTSPRNYPPTLITTADHDDRVVPAHSFKFAATIQAAQIGSAPVLIRIDTKAGHGAGTPTSKRIEKIADEWAFLIDSLHFVPTLN